MSKSKKLGKRFWQSLSLSEEEYRREVKKLNRLEKTKKAQEANLKWLRDAEQIKD